MDQRRISRRPAKEGDTKLLGIQGVTGAAFSKARQKRRHKALVIADATERPLLPAPNDRSALFRALRERTTLERPIHGPNVPDLDLT